MILMRSCLIFSRLSSSFKTSVCNIFRRDVMIPRSLWVLVFCLRQIKVAVEYVDLLFSEYDDVTIPMMHILCHICLPKLSSMIMEFLLTLYGFRTILPCKCVDAGEQTLSSQPLSGLGRTCNVCDQ